MSLGITVKFRTTLPEIIASVTYPAFAMELQHSNVTLKNLRNIDEIKFVLGQRDFVFIPAKGSHESEPCLYVDFYRVEGGKIAERWESTSERPPYEDWKNNNGML